MGMLFCGALLRRLIVPNTGMLRCQNNTADHIRTLLPRHNRRKIQDKLALRMTDDGQIGIFTLRYIRRNANLKLIVFLFHSCMFLFLF